MKTLLVAASLALVAATASHAAEMPKQIQGTWCLVNYDPANMLSTFKRGPCANKSVQRTISASGYHDSGSQVTCTVTTIEPSVKIGWDVDFGCLYSKQRGDHGATSFLVYPMTGGRLGMTQLSP